MLDIVSDVMVTECKVAVEQDSECYLITHCHKLNIKSDLQTSVHQCLCHIVWDYLKITKQNQTHYENTTLPWCVSRVLCRNQNVWFWFGIILTSVDLQVVLILGNRTRGPVATHCDWRMRSAIIVSGVNGSAIYDRRGGTNC
ncbi:hypothetical protein J6590_088724 [Homalodisca vitripennis]|nr:hypothetical protein J6590_088724 [Homalodisca vitripennis]